jgi:hypothetical protein
MDYITTVQTEDMAKTMSKKAKSLVIKTKRIRVCLKYLLKTRPYFSVVIESFLYVQYGVKITYVSIKNLFLLQEMRTVHAKTESTLGRKHQKCVLCYPSNELTFRVPVTGTSYSTN